MIYLAVSIDVEPDCTLTWHYSNPLTFEGVKIGIKERLQPLFNKYGIIPTYLINNVVLENAASTDTFRNLEGQFELGTHLHPEFIAPQKSISNYAGSKGEANCNAYSPEIEYEKIKNITTLFQNNFGYSPTSFRAGRFSAGNNTFKALDELGYKIDTSVTPHLCWSDKTREKAVDYRTFPEQPFKITDKLLEVPVSIREINNPLFLELLKSGMGIRRKIQTKQMVWLRPVYSKLTQLKNILQTALREDSSDKTIVLNMMFHNVEVLPSLSPYTKNNNDCTAYLGTLESFFQLCKKEKVEFINLSALYEHYQK